MKICELTIPFCCLGWFGRVPEDGAIGSVQSEKMAHQFLILAALNFGNAVAGVAGEINTISEKHRARCTRSWQRHFPSDIGLRVPCEREILCLRNTAAARPAELRPVGGGKAKHEVEKQ